MKNIIRILSVVLALSMLLTGCSLWKPTLEGSGQVAATYGDGQELSTGEYLAYLYNEINNIYTYYGQYGMDASTQSFSYGEGDDAKKDLTLMEYVALSTPDSIKTMIALDKLIADNGIAFTDKDYEKFDDLHESYHSLTEEKEHFQAGAYLPLGISDEHFLSVYEKQALNYYKAFYGLYGKGGVEEVKDAEIRKYFDKNYLSYKIITLNLTKTEKDKDGKDKTVDMSKKEKAEQMKKLEGYLKICNEKGFEKAMDQYNKDVADKDEKVEPTKDADNRQDQDATSMDEYLAKAIRTVKVGETKIVEYKAGGTTASAALIVRLDPNKPGKLYDDSYESILYSLKYEKFQEMVEKKADEVKIEFNQDVLDVCTPEQMMEDMEKASA